MAQSSRANNLFEFFVGPSLFDEEEDPIEIFLTDDQVDSLCINDLPMWQWVFNHINSVLIDRERKF